MSKQLESRVEALEERVIALEEKINHRPSGRDERPREVGAEDQALAAKLRQWRYDRSQEQGVKPFHVFGDRVLADLATTKPADKFELSKIKGFGEGRMLQYSDDVLAIIREELDW